MQRSVENMVRRLGEVLQTLGGYGFHIYDDGGARWITIRYETEDAARKARDLIAKALVGAISVKVHG
jgi:lysozyme family protein